MVNLILQNSELISQYIIEYIEKNIDDDGDFEGIVEIYIKELDKTFTFQPLVETTQYKNTICNNYGMGEQCVTISQGFEIKNIIISECSYYDDDDEYDCSNCVKEINNNLKKLI